MRSKNKSTEATELFQNLKTYADWWIQRNQEKKQEA